MDRVRMCAQKKGQKVKTVVGVIMIMMVIMRMSGLGKDNMPFTIMPVMNMWYYLMQQVQAEHAQKRNGCYFFISLHRCKLNKK